MCLTWITRMRLQSACFSREHRVFRLHPSLSREEMKNINYILDIFNYNCLETLRVRTAGSRAPVADAARERGRCGRAGGWPAAGSTRPGRASTGPGPTRWARPPGSGEGGGGGPESRASNEGPHKGFKSRRRPLLGPHPCWKQLLPLSPLRHYAKWVFRHEIGLYFCVGNPMSSM